MTTILKYSLYIFIGIFLFNSTPLNSQVPVREEPRHRLVLQNNYIRLLDVWIEPGDTTLFHIHATPSLFCYYTNTSIATQIKGQDWVKEQTIAGKAWFRSFSPDKLIHRVCNVDSTELHVVDVELLSEYMKDDLYHDIPLPFPILFENEKTIAYQVTPSSFSKENFIGRGPIIAEMISGDPIEFHNVFMNQTEVIKKGQFLFIEPGTSFYFSTPETSQVNMVLFEIK